MSISSLKQLQAMDNEYLTEEEALIYTRTKAREIGIKNSDFEILMMKLFASVQKIGGKVIRIGRIIFAKIIEFFEELSEFIAKNSNAIIGLILGLVLGAFLNFIPIIGPLLELICGVLGFSVGMLLDSVKKISQEVYDLFCSFWNKIKEIFTAIKNEFGTW